MPQPPIEFIHDVRFADLPVATVHAARRSLLDLLAVAAAGSQTQLAGVITDHAVKYYGPGAQPARLLFDGRTCSLPGAALAGGMQIDSVDAHDGHKLTKGHAGCGVLPALLAFTEADESVDEAQLLTSLVVGYEVAVRCGIALHATAPDYHTSGAWVAVAAAALGARHLQLSQAKTREAIGIAEYHGPRSQMMRCIDHPTMLKDGSGWGSMCGVTAALLAADGFTGAPALTVESSDAAAVWADLGSRWTMNEQYLKLYPVCRWAQPAIIAALALREQHAFDASQIKSVSVGTFHESRRLSTAKPVTTEQAQYSLPFPVACALVKGQVGVEDIDGPGLHDPDVVRLSEKITMHEVDAYNAAFPAQRISDVTVTLLDDTQYRSEPTEAAGDPESPLSDGELSAKYFRLLRPVLSEARAQALHDCVMSFGVRRDLQDFNQLIYPLAGAEQATRVSEARR